MKWHGAGVVVALVAALAATLVAAGPAASKPASKPAAEGIVARAIAQDPAEVRRYWTAARMRNAAPALVAPDPGRDPRSGDSGQPSYVGPASPQGGPVARLRGGVASNARASDVSSSSSSYPRRVHGKVFLTLEGTDYVCSGTVVNSFSHALVWTAGHCVNGADIGAGFASNWIFVPGFRDGKRPYGTWSATRLLTTREWQTGANVRFDVGAAVLARDGNGHGIQDVVGGRGIAFGQPRSQTFEILGYPAGDLLPLLPPNFTGDRLWSCRSPRTGDDSPTGGGGPETIEIECDMTAGASGGGWVIGSQFVNSVTSYGYQFDFDHLYGPYQGSVAENLYQRARGPRLECGRVAVTNAGTSGPDDFEGRPVRDGFLLRAGADSATGRAGADAACGGGGEDRLEGGSGGDDLRGGGGGDLLIGGPGRDVCRGGPGRDRARGCERKLGIP
jgi:RTX calcium-binding nonapeptide repeat (4 copies)